MQPLASIIIVSYNKRDDIVRCLRSVLKSSESAFEVVVVDNASTDGSADAVVETFPDVITIRSETNLGFGGGCNLGVSHASAGCLVFLNPDTVVDSGWLGPLVSATSAITGIDSPAAVGLATSKVLMLREPDRINTCGNTVHITGLTLCRGLGALDSSFADEDEVDAVSGAAFAIRRDVFEALGGFDESMFLYMEDTDLSLRARLAGWQSVCVPRSRVFHDYSLKMFPLKVFYQERNRYLMLLKSFKWATLLALSPALLIAEVITWGFVLLYDRSNVANKVRAYAWVVNNWSAIVQARRATQSLRRIKDNGLLQHTSFRLELGQARGGGMARLAQRLLDPLFWVLRRLTLALVRW
jgi:GT2 family glycosyltransferase